MRPLPSRDARTLKEIRDDAIARGFSPEEAAELAARQHRMEHRPKRITCSLVGLDTPRPPEPYPSQYQDHDDEDEAE